MARAAGVSVVAVTYSGPMFDGHIYLVVRRIMAVAVATVTDMTDAELRKGFGKFKHPTGHFESKVLMTPVTELSRLIDDPVIYGPWLEGTSKRNQSTRFKGYKIWQRTRQKMNKVAGPVAQAIFDARITEMN